MPAVPDVGDRLLILGADPVTLNATPLLRTPLNVSSTTFPGVAPDGTVTITVLLVPQLEIAASVPLKKTDPLVVRKLVPCRVTDDPTAPDAGDTLVTFGPGNHMPLLAMPPTVTTTLPSVAVEASGTTIEVLLQ